MRTASKHRRSSWNYEFTTKARKWFGTIKEKALLEKIASVIEQEIAIDPYRGDEKCGEQKGVWGKRVNFTGISYRIAYTINEEKCLVRILMVGPREGFYKELKEYLRG